MLLDYYQNVSMLHGSIRSLRHDLSNHLAVPEEGYRESLLRICKEIDGQIHRQLAWQTLDVPQLSSREKYEIYQYVQQLLQKKKLPTEALCITTEENQVSLAIDTTGRRSLHPALLRSSSFFRMLVTILKQHNGTATRAERRKFMYFYTYTFNDPRISGADQHRHHHLAVPCQPEAETAE